LNSRDHRGPSSLLAAGQIPPTSAGVLFGNVRPWSDQAFRPWWERWKFLATRATPRLMSSWSFYVRCVQRAQRAAFRLYKDTLRKFNNCLKSPMARSLLKSELRCDYADNWLHVVKLETPLKRKRE
jgi:hypothetical protein